jgi:hypothetical protein
MADTGEDEDTTPSRRSSKKPLQVQEILDNLSPQEKENKQTLVGLGALKNT